MTEERLNQLKRQANEALASAEKFDAKNWEEASANAIKKMNAKELLKQLDIYENVMTDEEKAELEGWSAFETDFRELKPIKEKYNLSWNDLKRLMTFTYGENARRSKWR